MTISDRCLERAQECDTAAKSHVCRSNAELRAALDKAAAVYRMVAGWAYEGASMADLAARCRARAAEYMESSKPYKGPARTAYIKGAATLREVADWAEKEQPRRRTRTPREVVGDPRESVSLSQAPEPQFPPSELYNAGGGFIGPEGDA